MKVILNEYQLEILVHCFINEALSIADDVSNTSFRLLEILKHEFEKHQEPQMISDEFWTSIFNTQFKIQWTLYSVNDISSSIPQIGASVDLRNKTIIVNAVKYNGYLDTSKLGDSLQHEIEHIYQWKNKPHNQLLSGKDSILYSSVLSILKNHAPTSAKYFIARGVYLMFNEEQDAYANGLYMFLHQVCKTSRDIVYYYKDSNAYKQLHFLNDFNNNLYDEKFTSTEEFKKVSDNLNRNIKWF